MAEHIWRSLDDDRDVSDAYARRHPDAVYDAADPEWLDILYGDDDAYDDDIDSDDYDEYDESQDDDRERGQSEGWDVDESDWGDDAMYDDDGYYEIEIGIDYGADT